MVPRPDATVSAPKAGGAFDLNMNSLSGVAAVDERIAKFLEKLSREIDIQFESSPFRSLDKRIVVAAGARTGSHLLCEKLQYHGIDIGELFNARRISKMCKKRNIATLSQYVNHVLTKFAKNGAFGVKGGVSMLSPLFAAGELPQFSGEWGWIYLKREDVVKQAISHFVAQKSGVFRSRSKRDGQPIDENEYDGDAISEFVLSHNRANEQWEQLFETFSIRPCRITYEQLAADPTGVAARVADAVGLNGPPIPGMKPPEAALQKQANALNAVWETRFLEERPEFSAKSAADAA